MPLKENRFKGQETSIAFVGFACGNVYPFLALVYIFEYRRLEAMDEPCCGKYRKVGLCFALHQNRSCKVVLYGVESQLFGGTQNTYCH